VKCKNRDTKIGTAFLYDPGTLGDCFVANYIGVDIGGTKIAIALVGEGGQVSKRRSRPTPVKDGGKAILSQAVDLVGELIKEARSEGTNIGGIGIGAGGQIDAAQGLVFSATDVLPGWKGLRLTEAFETAYNLPCKADNDVNVLALGEWRFGAAKNFAEKKPTATIVFLALGTGVGGALIKAGEVHHGAHWSGGEFGHILLSMDGDARCDTGGARGTLEAYCSGPGMVATYLELCAGAGNCVTDAAVADAGVTLAGASTASASTASASTASASIASASTAGASSAGMASARATAASVTGEDVVAAANLEKSRAVTAGPGMMAIALTGRYLGFGLTTLANALDPDLIIIGGGLATLGEDLLGPAREVLKERALPGPATCPVVIAGLAADAAVVGAAALLI